MYVKKSKSFFNEKRKGLVDQTLMLLSGKLIFGYVYMSVVWCVCVLCVCGMVYVHMWDGVHMLMVCLVYGSCGVGVSMLCAHIVSGGCLYLKWRILLAKLVRVPGRYT